MSTPRFPGIYEAPKRRGPLEWTIFLVLALLLAAGGVLIGGAVAGWWGPWKTASSVTTTTVISRGTLQAQIQTEMPTHVSGVVNVVCVMPSSWSPGKTFTCYGYGSSQRELAQMNGTVLPDNGTESRWNETWSVEPYASPPVTSASGTSGNTGSGGCCSTGGTP